MMKSAIYVLQNRATVLMFAVILSACAAVAMPLYAQSKPTSRMPSVIINDPIFEMDYDASKVHFELIETSILMKSCNEYRGVYKKLPLQLYLYAQYKRDATSIYIVDSANGIEERVFAIRNGVCDLGDTPLTIRQIPSHRGGRPLLTDAEVAGLIEDALFRYEKAFGGKKHLLKLLDETLEWRPGGCKAVSTGLCVGVRPLQPFILEIMSNYRK